MIIISFFAQAHDPFFFNLLMADMGHSTLVQRGVLLNSRKHIFLSASTMLRNILLALSWFQSFDMLGRKPSWAANLGSNTAGFCPITN